MPLFWILYMFAAHGGMHEGVPARARGRLDLCRHRLLTSDQVAARPLIKFLRAAYFGGPPVVVLGCCSVCCFGPV
jgi:hypothetical protein